MTSEEKQEIITAVLAALATNSKSISQLTAITEALGSDLIELAGGRRITIAHLLAGLATSAELTAAGEYLDANKIGFGTDSMADWTHCRVVYLDGMGSLDDGGIIGSGIYYNPSDKKIYDYVGELAPAQSPKEGAIYISKNTGKVYMWNGSDMEEVPGGGVNVINDLVTGGEDDALSAEMGKVLKGLIDNIGTGSIAAFSQYAVFESVSALPATGVATTGYIVGNHIYAYVGTGGDTRDGKYQDLGTLGAAGVSVTTAEDGTITIHAGGNDYTVNLNHTHEGMAKLEKFVAVNPPATMNNDTIYVQVDNLTTPTEIESIWLFGCEFAGGGVPDTGEPMIKSPANGSTINLGANDGSGVSNTIRVTGKNLTEDLTVSASTGLTLSYGQSTGQSSVTIPKAQALIGADITVSYSGSGGFDGALVITHDNDVLSTVAVKVDWGYITNGLAFHLDGADATTSQWVDRIGGIAFAMNNVTLDGNGGVVFNGTNSYGIYAAASTLGFKPHTHTIEVVANIGGAATALLFMQNSESDLALGITGSGNIIACAQTDVYARTYLRKIESQQRGLMSLSFADTNAYRNKVSQSVLNDGCFDPTANAGVFIGARDTTRSFLQGTIYQIRIYNRLLTSAEILANQQIDIDRYNIS